MAVAVVSPAVVEPVAVAVAGKQGILCKCMAIVAVYQGVAVVWLIRCNHMAFAYKDIKNDTLATKCH